MRRLPSAALVIALLLGASATPASAQQRRTACDVAGSRTIVANSRSRVFVRRGVLYGCRTATGRRRRIPHALSCAFGECTTAGLLLAGPYVAFASDPVFEPRSGERYVSVFVVDIRTGAIVHRAESLPRGELGEITYDRCTSDERAEQRCAPGAEVGSMVLTVQGAVAWTVEVTFTGSSEPPRREVRVLDRAGLRRIAAGPSIDPTSLARAGRILYWTEADGPRTARLS